MIFLNFTATTATFGVNMLKYRLLSGGSRGGSRVIMVAVEAVFHSKPRVFYANLKLNRHVCDKNSNNSA